MNHHPRLLIAVVVIGILAIPGFVIYINREQHDRVDAIQASRVASCRETYRAFPEMFQPFFPRERKNWTPEQRQAFTKLENRSDELAARCGQQTNPR